MTLPIAKIPEYFKDLSDKSNITAQEICIILGYKDYRIIYTMVYEGKFPKYDIEFKGNSNISFAKIGRNNDGRRKIFWYKSTIEKYIKEMNAKKLSSQQNQL